MTTTTPPLDLDELEHRYFPCYKDDVLSLIAEVKCLRAENELRWATQGECDIAVEERDTAKAEVERLKAECAKYEDSQNRVEIRYLDKFEENRRLRAEIGGLQRMHAVRLEVAESLTADRDAWEREAKIFSEKYYSEKEASQVLETERDAAIAERDALKVELTDANHWRERHGKDAIAYGKQSQENWQECEKLRARVAELENHRCDEWGT